MLREHGIPCVVLTSDTHAWNAVYIDGRWQEVDITVDINRYVDGADINVIRGTQLYCYDGFFTPEVNNASAIDATDYCWK